MPRHLIQAFSWISSHELAKDGLAHIGSSHASCSTLQGSPEHYQDFKWQDGLLFYKNLLYVLHRSPWLQVLEHCHNSLWMHILVLPRPLSWWIVRFGGLTCKTLPKITFAHVTPIVEPKYPGIILMACYNHYRLQPSHGSLFLWISLQICHLQTTLILF